jgi:hypothetical protein
MRLGRMLTTFAVVAAMFSAPLPTRWAGAEMAGNSMSDMVKNAQTAADHEALATMYDKEAADAKSMAAEHRQMKKSYMSLTGRQFSVGAMPQHCDSLAKTFDEQAAMYEKMAAAERDMAKRAK